MVAATYRCFQYAETLVLLLTDANCTQVNLSSQLNVVVLVSRPRRDDLTHYELDEIQKQNILIGNDISKFR